MNFQQNNLQHSSSLYLQQHADQPVHWQEWNANTLQHAQQVNKPLIISIGYSTCHWCHVMAHEAFSNTSIAQYMNENFVCIKVDRETHPDIDQIYMKAVQAFTGQGGWPLNCFALPNGKPFHGGLYFKEPDWLNTLQQIHNLYTQNYSDVLDFAAQITSTLKEQQRSHPLPVAQVNHDEMKDVLLDIEEEFDSHYGGFKGAPKFPLPDTWLSLAQINSHYNMDAITEQLNHVAETFLTKGIHDIVEGGWFRYSVTADWNWPHFEKMLYDQGLILSFLVHQHVDAAYLQPHLQFILKKLTQDHSLFFAGIDADTDGIEGGYYLFSASEFTDNALKDLVHLRDSKELQHLYVDSYPALDKFNTQYKAACTAVRSSKKPPVKDTKEIVAWNALTLQALLQYGWAYKDDKVLAESISLAHQFYNLVVAPDGKVKRLAADREFKGYLDDHVFTAYSCFWTYQVTQEESWLLHAKKIVESTIDLFYNATTPLFNFSSYLHENTFIVPHETVDNVIPSSNSVLSDLLFTLAPVFGENDWHKTAQAMNSAVQPKAMKDPISYTHWLSNLVKNQKGPKEIYIIGPEAHQWHRNLPASIVLEYAIYTAPDTTSKLLSLKQKAASFQDYTFALVCKDYHCSHKLNSYKELCISIG